MTPEEYKRAESSLRKYGEYYDWNVDNYLPSDLVKTKARKIAKRQPKYHQRTKAYYQAQCSFRGLRTTGNSEELQQALKARDRAHDLRVKQALDQLQGQIRLQNEKNERERAERWWNDPARTLGEKADVDAMRALRERLMRDDTLTRSCYISKRDFSGLQCAAEQLGLCCELVNAPSSLSPPDGFYGRSAVFVIGQAAAVRKRAQEISDESAEEDRQIEARRQAQAQALKAAEAQRRQILLGEAQRMDDWDLTGEWDFECHEMATHMSNTPAKLQMSIYRTDNFDVVDPAWDNPEDFSDYGYYD